MKSAYLLTGVPGVGKTTLIRQAMKNLGDEAGGFFTEEIRVNDVRIGFRIVTLAGQKAKLAGAEILSSYHVGKYGVDIRGIEDVAVPALEKAYRECDVVVIDEIGKMELFSDRFKEVVLEIISSGKRVLGTIMFKPDPWADKLKKKSQVNLLHVTHSNHADMLEKMEKWLETIRPKGKT
jgi:nucleoside-triphosphatase